MCFSQKDFYSEINRKELYLRYVYKLSKLHLDCDNYTEAGYTLKLHTDLLRWTTESLSTALRSPLYPEVTQHGILKEMLYSQIIDHFDKGKVSPVAYMEVIMKEGVYGVSCRVKLCMIRHVDECVCTDVGVCCVCNVCVYRCACMLCM